MPFISPSQSGIFASGLQALVKVVVDSEKLAKVGENIFPGRAVTIGTAGTIESADETSTFVYGLTDTNMNTYSSDVQSATGEYGSGKINVISWARVILRPNVYLASDGSEFTVQSYDTSAGALAAYAPGVQLVVDATAADINNTDPLYTAKGRVTYFGKAGAGTVVVGYITKKPTATDVEMEAMIRC